MTSSSSSIRWRDSGFACRSIRSGPRPARSTARGDSPDSVAPHAGQAVLGRVVEPVELSAYRSGASDWFGLTPASHASAVQPFAGPLAPGTTAISAVPGTLAADVQPSGRRWCSAALRRDGPRRCTSRCRARDGARGTGVARLPGPGRNPVRRGAGATGRRRAVAHRRGDRRGECPRVGPGCARRRSRHAERRSGAALPGRHAFRRLVVEYRGRRSGALIRLTVTAVRRATDGTPYAARRASLLLSRDPADTVRVLARRARF